jgi:hypothetical protein
MVKPTSSVVSTYVAPVAITSQSSPAVSQASHSVVVDAGPPVYDGTWAVSVSPSIG